MEGPPQFHHMPSPYGMVATHGHGMQPPQQYHQVPHHPEQVIPHPEDHLQAQAHAYNPAQQGHHQEGQGLDPGQEYQDGSLYSAVVEAGMEKAPVEDIDDELLARIEVSELSDAQIRTRLRLLSAEAQKRGVQMDDWLSGVHPPPLSDAEQLKVEKARTAKAERRLGRIFEGLVKEVGGCGWIYGFITASGTPKSGASDSMRKWWLEHVRFNEVACPDRKAPLNTSRLPKTANLSDCDGKSPQQLMIKLTHRQLASMASEWLRLCEPSAAQYPLNGSGGSPPWWPENIQYKKPDLLKNQALTEVLELGLKNFLPNMFATDASEVLVKILIRSKVLRKAGAAEIAIVVKVINTAVAQWAKPDPPRRAAIPGQARARQGRPKRIDGGTNYTGMMAGVDGSGYKRKRRKREEIEERPFKCELCDHPGYTSRGGLSDHKCTSGARMDHLQDNGLGGGQMVPPLAGQLGGQMMGEGMDPGMEHPAMSYDHEDTAIGQMHGHHGIPS